MPCFKTFFPPSALSAAFHKVFEEWVYSLKTKQEITLLCKLIICLQEEK